MTGFTLTPPPPDATSSRSLPDDARRMPARASWLRRLQHLLLTSDQRQQIRLAQSGLANLLMLGSVGLVHLLDASGVPVGRWLWPWTLASIGGMVAVFAVIRSGRVQHWRDPSLTIQQMFYAVLCAAGAYCITGSERSTVIPMLAVVLMFGMFGMTRHQMHVVAAYAAVVFGAASLYWLAGPDRGRPVGPELTRFLMVVIVLLGVVTLTSRLHGMRERSRRQRHALATALDRIRELATRDELTGCLNRRAMLERMAEESLRCARLGQSMCLVLLDLDHFKRVNDLHGHAAGDRVLRGFAELARGQLRGTDLLARWGGEEFLLLLGATDAPQGRPCVQRLLDALAATPFDGVSITCSAGLAECRGGESIVAAVERADQALYRAKAGGRNRVEQG